MKAHERELSRPNPSSFGLEIILIKIAITKTEILQLIDETPTLMSTTLHSLKDQACMHP